MYWRVDVLACSERRARRRQKQKAKAVSWQVSVGIDEGRGRSKVWRVILVIDALCVLECGNYCAVTGDSRSSSAITFEFADNMIQQQRPLLWKLLKFKCSTRWTVGGHVRRHGWSDLGGRDLAKRRATIVRWPGIAGRAAAITFEFADNMKQQQRLLWKLLKFKCWIRWTVGGYVRRDAVMALVESASDGWLFLMSGVQWHSCNVGRQQRYWKMTVGIGARSRIIRRPWTGSFDGIAVSFTYSKFVLHQFLFSFQTNKY